VTTTNRKIHKGFSNNLFLDPYDVQQQTSPHAPQQTPMKIYSLVKFMLSAGAYTWHPWTRYTCFVTNRSKIYIA